MPYKRRVPDIFNWAMLCLILITSCNETVIPESRADPVTYYIDSIDGNDENNGLSEDVPWKTLSKVEETPLLPGDNIRFKRGSAYIGSLLIKYSGEPENYITFTDYGNPEQPAPSFTNPVFDSKQNQFGNCIRLQGDYLIVEHLYFEDTPAEIDDPTAGFLTMWELGAVYIDKMAGHCIVRNNEIRDCGVGIKSYGEHAIIEHNYIHDCNRVLKKWSWGPIGIWLGGDHQEIRYNRIVNYSAVDPRIIWGENSYGGGADGGAMEIDDARVDKSDISIHHNYTRECQGFLEVTWSDVGSNPDYRDFSIHHNVSDDYQQFIALWRGANCKIENNTVVRRRINANDWGVFNITQYDSRNLIRNNLVVVENNIRIFNLGKEDNAQPNNIIRNNLYYAASDTLNMGLEGPGDESLISAPDLLHYADGNEPRDFSLTAESPAIDQGLDLGYSADFMTTPIPQQDGPDIGAFEYKSN